MSDAPSPSRCQVDDNRIASGDTDRVRIWAPKERVASPCRHGVFVVIRPAEIAVVSTAVQERVAAGPAQRLVVSPAGRDLVKSPAAVDVVVPAPTCDPVVAPARQDSVCSGTPAEVVDALQSSDQIVAGTDLDDIWPRSADEDVTPVGTDDRGGCAQARRPLGVGRPAQLSDAASGYDDQEAHSYRTSSFAKMFVRSLSMTGRSACLVKFSTPAANTFAPPGVR
jgi:hypothetical protein